MQHPCGSPLGRLHSEEEPYGTSPPSISASGRYRCRAAGRLAHCMGTDLSRATDTLDRVVYCRWTKRHRGARIIGQYLSERLGQQFLIENKVGAGGNIGMAAVLSSPPDGYTIGFVAPNNAINATLYDKLPFDFVHDSAPVAGTMLLTNVMVVHPDVPAKTVAEFIAYAKANPGKINMASSGSGTSVHMSGELFKVMTGINMQHVPYRGSAPAMQDLLSNRVQVMFDNGTESVVSMP